MSSRPSFVMSADARLLYQALRAAQPGDILSYAALSQAISRDVMAATPALRTAMRRALRDDGMVFAPLRGEGLKRLTDAEIVASAPAMQRKLRRAARRNVEVMTKVSDFDALTETQKRAHSANLSIMASVAHLASEKSVARLESAVADRGARELPLAETLRLFAQP